MKNKTLLLTKILFKNGEGFGVRNSKNPLSKLLLIGLALFIGPGLASMFAKFLLEVYEPLSLIGQEGIILTWTIATDSVLIFLFGIFYVISIFYMASDIETFLALPLRSSQIIGAKFLAVLVYEYFIVAITYLPALLVYGIKGGLPFLYYLYGIIIFFLIPIVPLAMCSVLVMIIMRFLNITKNRDAFKLVGGLVAIALSIGINVLMNRFAIASTAGNLQELLLKGNNSLSLLTTNIFPSASWAVRALIDNSTLNGFYNFVLFSVVSVGVYALLIFIAELIYFKGVIGSSETRSRRKSISSVDLDKALVKSSPIKSYTLIEIKNLIRTPIYLLNCVLINFFWPLIALMPVITQPSEVSMVEELSKLMQNNEYVNFVFVGAIAVLYFIGGTNGIAATAISREGQELFVKKYIPISFKDQIRAKVMSSFIIGLTGVIVFLIFAVAVFKAPIHLAIMVLLVGWMPLLLTSYIGIFIDIYNPKLNWDTEHKAVKQNMNVVYSIIISIVIGALVFLAGFNFSLFELNFYLVAFLLFVFNGALVLGMRSLVLTAGVKRFSKLN